MFNKIHMDGSVIADLADRKLLSEGQRTGKFFPGRPQIRLLMTFRNLPKKENSWTCRKNYLKSDSPSPEIFTFQSACQYPKLIGISVKQEFNGVSTTLSILRSRFSILPQFCYHQHACNMSRYITLRCSEVS